MRTERFEFDSAGETAERIRRWSAEFAERVEVSEIAAAVRERGDAAVIELTREHDSPGFEGPLEVPDEAIEKALAAEWAPALAAMYGELPGLEAEARVAEARLRIERAERWLLEHERDPELLATLGRLCAQAELWGKAKSFLEASLSFEPTRTAHLELARLSERLGENEDAQRHYRRAAELS